jgi:hypothetical protein
MSESVKTEEAVKDVLDQIHEEHSIKPGSPEMEAFLSAGYPQVGSREHANEIIEAWKKDHTSCPWELKEQAIAFLAALNPPAASAVVYHPQTTRRGEVIRDEGDKPKGRKSPGRAASRE